MTKIDFLYRTESNVYSRQEKYNLKLD